MEDRYLGDGVYASFDGYHIWLDLRGQDNYTKIALDSYALKGFIEYAKAVGMVEEEKK